MTSTHTFQGMDQGARSSSRVLAPPGGGSSNIFGVETPAPAKQPPKTQPAIKQESVQPQEKPQERVIRGAPKQAFNPITGEPYGQSPAKADNNKAKAEEDEEETENQNGSATEESSATKGKQQTQPPPDEKEHTSTRILNPPGGRSTKLW